MREWSVLFSERQLKTLLLCTILLMPGWLTGQEKFPWPEGKRFAISLSFDDTRPTVLEHGIPLLNSYGLRATFYAHPHVVQQRLAGWKAAVSSGHEIGNHTSLHPCSENFWWIRNGPHKPLEEYTPESMEKELLETNRQLEELLGVVPTSFAYPCGQMQVGRGEGKKSYIPVIASLFTSGRGWLDEAPADPHYCDLAELPGISVDDMDFEALLPMINAARESGLWLVLAGHDTGPENAPQTTRMKFLKDLCEYVKADDGIWMAPVGEVAAYVEDTRTNGRLLRTDPLPVTTDSQGNINLKASLGRGNGPGITYRADRKAFTGWSTQDTAVWHIRHGAPATTYQIEIEWSVSEREAGKSVRLVVDGKEHLITIRSTGGPGTFRKETVGRVHLTEGKHSLTMVPVDRSPDGWLMELRAIRLIQAPQ